jgi:CRP/FNR family cyclic AMP-dependent transcriptional regulator
MIERFQDRKRLLDALLLQKLIHGDGSIADAFADVLELREYKAGEVLISQDGGDDHICLILAGDVDIIVNGRPIAKRHSGEHVGEMALLNPDGTRTATVTATETTVVGCVTEMVFSPIAARWPVVWRRVASILSDRLKQRGKYVRQRNDTPIMFIGSSKEGLEIAQCIQSGLAHDDMIVRIWTDQVFGASNYSLEDLEREVSDSDFGVLVLTPDDKIISRDKTEGAPRDNVIFELGMLIGAIGRERTYFVVPRGQDVRIPSDLFGVNPLTYVPVTGRDLAARLGPICSALRDKVRALGPR